MATLSKQTFDEAGQDLTLSAAASGGDQFDNTGGDKPKLIIKNGDTAGKTVTITAQNTSFEFGRSGKVVKQDQSLTVAAGSVGIMGPFATDAFNDSNGNVQITYSAVTSLEVAVVVED